MSYSDSHEAVCHCGCLLTTLTTAVNQKEQFELVNVYTSILQFKHKSHFNQNTLKTLSNFILISSVFADNWYARHFNTFYYVSIFIKTSLIFNQSTLDMGFWVWGDGCWVLDLWKKTLPKGEMI